MKLERLLAPKSIAVLGASERPSIGRTVIESLRVLGFDGPVYPVNPKYETVLGQRCYASLDAIDSPVDAVAMAVNRNRVVDELENAARTGVGAAVVFGGGFAESDGDGRDLQQRLVAVCKEAGIALCGPNCMGILSPHHRSHLYMLELTDADNVAGNVGVITQSGSVSISWVSDVRRYGFSHVISSGNEAVVNTADYIEYLTADVNTDVIALFSETIVEPERFVAALDAAADAGKPVVILKVGKSRRAAAAVQTHTGGLAGDARVLSAVLRAHRAIEVDDLEEMSEVVAACQGKRWPQGRRLAVVTASGGHAELMLDMAEAAHLELPPLPPGTRATIEETVGTLTGDGNPVDAWGQSGDYMTNFPCALKALGECDAYDAIAMTIDGMDGQPVEYESWSKSYADFLIDAQKFSNKPFYILGTRHSVFRTDQVNWLRARRIAQLSGIRQGLGALARLGDFSQPLTALRSVATESESVLEGQQARHTISEYDAGRMMSACGLPIVSTSLVSNFEDARTAAEEMVYPIVLKVVADTIPHRTDAGLVVIGIADDKALAEAWKTIATKLDAMDLVEPVDAFLVQKMVSPGVEVIAGIKRDPAFGLVFAMGVGGTLTELLNDVALRPLPLRQGDVEAMIDETRVGMLLDGVRGAPPADRDALVQALYAIADFAVANEPYLAGIDVNPIVVHAQGRGCCAVDALIVPRTP